MLGGRDPGEQGREREGGELPERELQHWEPRGKEDPASGNTTTAAIAGLWIFFNLYLFCFSTGNRAFGFKSSVYEHFLSRIFSKFSNNKQIIDAQIVPTSSNCF